MTTNPRDIPAYSFRDVVWYAACSHDSAHRWIGAGVLSAPLGTDTLSFNHLVEVFLLRCLRSHSFERLREALAAAGTVLKTSRPLLRRQTTESAYALASSSLNPGEALRRIEAALVRIEYDEAGDACRFYPSLWGADKKQVCIDPSRAFGRPVLVDSGVSTDAVASRFRSGEALASLSRDLGIAAEAAEAAVRFEMLRK